MLINRNTLLGFICVFGWISISAFSRVFIGSVETTFNPIILCFYTFLLAQIFAVSLNFRRLSMVKKALVEQWPSILKLNFATFLAWFFLIYALHYIEPSIVSSITLGISPILVLLLNGIVLPRKSYKTRDYCVALIIFLLISYLCVLCVIGDTSLITTNVNYKTILIALGLAAVAGFGVALVTLYLKKLTNLKLVPQDIMSIRFTLLVILSGLIGLASGQSFVLTTPQLLDVVLIASVMIFLPLFLMIIGVSKLDPISVTIAAPLLPSLVFFFEYFNKQLHPTYAVFAGIVGIVIVMIVSTLWRFSDENNQAKSLNDLGNPHQK